VPELLATTMLENATDATLPPEKQQRKEEVNIRSVDRGTHGFADTSSEPFTSTATFDAWMDTAIDRRVLD
jgi:hypothetical protein